MSRRIWICSIRKFNYFSVFIVKKVSYTLSSNGRAPSEQLSFVIFITQKEITSQTDLYLGILSSKTYVFQDNLSNSQFD